MLKYFILVIFSIFANGQWIQSIFLENIKSIKSINVSFENNKGDNESQFIKIGDDFLEDVIIFSEERQDMFLGSFMLKSPHTVNLFKIIYIDNNDKSIDKLVYIDKGSINSNRIYFYEKKDYFYSNKIIDNKPIIKDNIVFENNLPIAYVDKDEFIDITLKKCNKINKDCDNVKHSYWDKRIIFYFNFIAKNDKNINLSNNLKRIQITYKKTRKYPTWVIVEAKKYIQKIKKLDNDNKKEITYRVYFD